MDINQKFKNNLIDIITNRDEYLTNPENNRLTTYPIQNHEIWEAYKKQQAAFWTAEEIDFSKDYNDFLKLNKNEQHFIKTILAFFSASDTIVNINIGERFIKDVKIREAIIAYDYQKMMENVHCVSSDTLILLHNGYYTIGSMVNKLVLVWNGVNFSPTTIEKKASSVLYRVELSNGMYLDCTPNHRWFIRKNNLKEIVETVELKIDDEINHYVIPFVDSFSNNISITLNNKSIYMNDTKSSKLQWLSDICNESGYLNRNIIYFYVDEKQANLIQLMLQQININCHLNKLKSIVYIDKNDLPKDFMTRGLLHIKTEDAIILPSKLTITNITLLDGIHETFCFTEKEEHAGVFNGILTGQSETYSLQIDNIIREPNEKNKLLNALEHFPCITKKAEWQLKWIESNELFSYRLIAFAIVEGVFFSGSFCSIFWLKQKNIMPGLCASNELIARDEGMHTNFAILLYSMIKNKIPEDKIHEMFIDAVEIETEFIVSSLPCSLLGINSDSMTVYIKYVADRLVSELGYNKIWNVKNPFDFMEKISMEGKTNFFEARPTQYQKSSIMNKTRDSSFELNDDF
jgi:ribonucleotide reductase beta subunit family protein with ferritin-like domain